MIIRATAVVASFVVMIAAFLAYVADLGIRVGPPDNRTNLAMDVTDVNNLVAGSNVLWRGVPVGKVDRVDTSISNATVHFYIDNKFTVPSDSLVRLENLSALGESYLELEPLKSGGPAFVDGQHIAPESIVAPKSITELGATLARTLEQLDPGQLQNVVNQADAALPDPYIVLPNLERAGKVLHNTTVGLNGQGKKALENLQSLLENAGFVGSMLAQPAPALKALGPQISKMWDAGVGFALRNDMPGDVYVFGKFMQRLQQFLDDRGSDLRVLTEPLTPNVQAIASALSNVDSSQILTNLLAATPPDGAIELHVTLPPNAQPAPPPADAQSVDQPVAPVEPPALPAGG
ncbi:mammalian cell entry protein [Mycobacterium sp. GA-1841]|uniref:MlaD family protein n=1 Tax=Mycobacterium sp. GA-1841 TaxID=1834154 RepID=UPI00096CE610|nr:MlaD family protein [Mycobacterium sp. GA-1841]OMC36739.1 mammalian cell entry protein [Mycobacterium sp. GA-1841]